MDTSIHCDTRDHDKCDGTALIFDTEDGPNRYICGCSCHNTECNERKCRECRGTGYVHDVRRNGRYSTVPGRVPETTP